MLAQFSVGVQTYIVLVLSYVMSCLPFVIIDRFNVLPHNKIQKEYETSSLLKNTAFRMILFNFSWLFVALTSVSPLLDYFFISTSHYPPVSVIFVQLTGCFIVDDIWFYCYHRYLHSNLCLYKMFHKPHHQFVAPYSWTSHAVHPVEMMLQSIGTMTLPLAIGMHLHVFWLWLCIRQYQGVLDHVGYDDLPFFLDPFSIIPGVGGTKFHDDHHQYFNCNYASCFSIIDIIFGTHRGSTNNTEKHKTKRS
jgi:methylsterol monooxygenase